MQRRVELSKGQPVLVLPKQVSGFPSAAFRLSPTPLLGHRVIQSSQKLIVNPGELFQNTCALGQ